MSDMLHQKLFRSKKTRQRIKRLMFRFSRELSMKILFRIFMDYGLNLENPRTFNEKLQWLKLYHFDERMQLCADKLLVREYIQKKGYGHTLNELYHVYDRAEDINFEELPDRFVLKANHGCKMNIVVNDKKGLDINRCRKKLDEWLTYNYYWQNLEWVYRDIDPKIICEKNLSKHQGKVPEDYKIFCFDGEPKIIAVDIDRYTNHCVNLYSQDWKQIDGKLGRPLYNGEIEKPELLEEMLEMARVISKGFPHVRVDLYNYEGRIVFGEMTFFSSAGFEHFEPYDLDLMMGGWISLPLKNN